MHAGKHENCLNHMRGGGEDVGRHDARDLVDTGRHSPLDQSCCQMRRDICANRLQCPESIKSMQINVRNCAIPCRPTFGSKYFGICTAVGRGDETGTGPLGRCRGGACHLNRRAYCIALTTFRLLSSSLLCTACGEMGGHSRQAACLERANRLQALHGATNQRAS